MASRPNFAFAGQRSRIGIVRDHELGVAVGEFLDDRELAFGPERRGPRDKT